METFFAYLTHILIIFAFVMKFILFTWAIFSAGSGIERILRSSALSTGLLIFFGARAAGLSLAEFMVSAIILVKPITFGLAAIVAPSCLGIFISWYVIRSLRKNTNKAIRIMILVGVFTIVQFGDIYVKALSIEGFQLDKAFVPNMCFTVALSLYAILRYEHRNS